MAFNIDYMANPTYGYEDEETRRRREEEERRRQQQALMQQPIQPIAPPQDFNSYIAQNESGGNPDIGYHFQQDAQGNRRSSAYGKYGITQAAYKDIQQTDPYFQNKSIESLSTADQDRAQTVYNGVLTRQLQAYGVEATPGNLAAADFLGARGFSDYIKTGAISNAAAQANGGADRVRQIVEQRRQFGNAPASGAAIQQGQGAPVSPDQLQQRTQQDQQAQVDQQLLGQGIKLPGVTPQPTVTPSTGAIESYQKNQDDPAALLNLRNDESLPSWIRERAGSRAYELLDMERKRTEAEQKMQATVQAAMAGDPKASREVANELSSKVATFGKMILAGFISPALAKEYAEELGFGNKSQVVRDEKGNVGMITLSASGKPVDGVLADGTKMNTEQLLKFAAGAGSQLDIVGGTYVNDRTGEVGRVVTDKKTGTSYIQTDTGRKPMTGFRPQSSMGTLADQRSRLIQEINLKLQGKTAEEQMAILRPYNQQLAAQGLPTISPQEVGIIAPQIAGGAAATTTTATPAPAQAVTTTPQAMPAAPAATAAPVVRPTGPQLEAQKAATVEEAKDYVEYKSKELLPKATAAGDIKNIRKQQLYGPDGILQNPELAGILQGGQGSEVFNIMRDAISGNYKDMNDLSARIQSLNLDKRQKEVLYTQIGLQRLLGPMTIRDTAPVGSISDSEQRMNTQNQVDILRNPLYAGLTLMTRDQFEKDMTIAKRDFADRNPNLNTRAKLDAAWNKESSKLREQYDQVYAARAAYIGKHNPNGTNPGAVIDAYKHYPVPVFDNGRWDFGTDFARRAARPKLKEFER